ncbi:MAG TPA: hypothetical protein VHC20_05210 [Candidatus Paceibacterota bacterium]|nr:hypothetical protein [Candidatus Paceibacterota bacterium]
MILRAWFQPKSGDADYDLKEHLRTKQMLGSWPLEVIKVVNGKKRFGIRHTFELPDGSTVRIRCGCVEDSRMPHASLNVDFGGDRLVHVAFDRNSGLSTVIATGKGGSLAINFVPAHEFPEKA